MEISKLYPIIKNNIWGGMKLAEKYGKCGDSMPFAESWELSFHKSGKCTLCDGRTLEEVADEKALGTNVLSFEFFPVLIKFIDAKDDLSIQVHPSDSYALLNENSFGKTEMWYVVEAEEGAGLYVGFREDVTREEYERAIKENTITSLLNFYKVKAGECYFIPSGTVHAIGNGTLIYEIQQNSDLTYRVYDYDRRDKFGNTRELHIEKALKVSNLKKYTKTEPKDKVIGRSKYFTVTKEEVKDSLVITTDKTTFKAFSCVKGEGIINGLPVKTGDSYFIPADYGEARFEGNAVLLITEIRRYSAKAENNRVIIKDDLGNIIAQADATHGEDFALDSLLSSLGMSREDLVSE